jgi:hypothetical protein
MPNSCKVVFSETTILETHIASLVRKEKVIRLHAFLAVNPATAAVLEGILGP